MSLLVADATALTPDGIVMPDLTGQVLATAASAITRAGLKLAPPLDASVSIPPVSSANATQSLTVSVAPGTVMSQSPAAGYRVDASTPVQLTVAR
jgi:beta-lactam-binding protein with PASTA domain